MRISAQLLFLLAITSCGPGTGGDDFLPPERFAPVYAEMLIWTTGADSLGRSARQAQDSILASSGMTREDFKATVDWYNRDLTRWGVLLQNVVRYLEEKSMLRKKNDPPKDPNTPSASQIR
jgi:hypothetical protein